MNLLAIPRHQVETTLGDYARMVRDLARPGDSLEPTRRFEAEFARYVRCRNAIAVASGRLGMRLVLKHIGVPRDCEAVIPAYNYFIVVEQFIGLGYRPVFVDARPGGLNLDERRVEELISPRTRILLATHMFGEPCEMDALKTLADRHDLVLIEDCAHALGASYRGCPVGTFGRAAVFSLSIMKLVTSFGGGMITTNDDGLAQRIREDLAQMRKKVSILETMKRFCKGMVLDVGTRRVPFSFGAWPALRAARAVWPNVQRRMMTDRPRSMGGCSSEPAARLHRFQVRLGRSQLRRADEFIAKRRQVMEWLDKALAGIDGVTLLRRSEHSRHNGMYYGILADESEKLSKYLFARGIDSETSEYGNCADLEMYASYRKDIAKPISAHEANTKSAFPVARDIEARILRLPNHPSLKRRDVERIGSCVRSFYERLDRKDHLCEMSSQPKEQPVSSIQRNKSERKVPAHSLSPSA